MPHPAPASLLSPGTPPKGDRAGGGKGELTLTELLIPDNSNASVVWDPPEAQQESPGGISPRQENNPNINTPFVLKIPGYKEQTEQIQQWASKKSPRDSMETE